MKILRQGLALIASGLGVTSRAAGTQPASSTPVVPQPSVGPQPSAAARPPQAPSPPLASVRSLPQAAKGGPLIGILPGAFLGPMHESVVRAGGHAVIIDPRAGRAAEQMAAVDALAICGGRDVDPKFYGEINTKSIGINAGGTAEDQFMIECIQKGYELGTPMLGVCRGHQLMNVADGGSLYQDFRSDRAETRLHAPPHDVSIAPDSTLARIIGATNWTTNSMHHQSVNVPGAHMRVTGQTSDGVVEAIQHVDHPDQIGVQFHPEVLRGTPEASSLFRFIVDSGAKFHSARVRTVAA